MSYLDEKYISLLSPQLRNFKRKGKVCNFSCPCCGDSLTDRRKARGYLFERNGTWFYSCKISACTTNLKGLIRHVDPELHRQYCMELFLGIDAGRAKADKEIKDKDFEAVVRATRRPSETPLSGLLRLSDLPADHMANHLVAIRRMPSARVLHCDAFRAWTNKIKPGTFEDKPYDEPRLVIPFMKDNRLVGFQGRSYDSHSKVKYYTINLDTDIPLLYGIDDIDTSKHVVCLEGPIDSMFIKNAVASAGGSISASIKASSIDLENVIVCYDNEPRSKHTVKKMRQAIYDGFSVCFWPNSFGFKDVNDAVMDDVDPAKITEIIHTCSKRGLSANLEMTRWRQCDA